MTYKDLLQSKFPENSWQGQCFTFMHKLCLFPPVGNFLNQKIASLNRFGIPLSKLDSFKVGDVVLQKYPIFGHGSMINAIVGTKLQLTESNRYLNGLVHHTRQIEHTDPRILGVFRGTLDYPIPPKFLNVKVIQKGAPWASMGAKYAEIYQRLSEYSGDRISINLDTTFTDLDIPLTTDGYPMNKGIPQAFLDANFAPLATNYDCYAVLLPYQNQTTFGWFSTPNKIQIFTDEARTSGSADDGVMNEFIYTMCHEIAHFLLSKTGQPDLTHTFLVDSPINGQPPKRDFKGLYSYIDYSKL